MPVIFVTGHDRAGMEERAMKLGATAYLRKPFDEEALLGAISKAMKSPLF
jgi:FixJ family two-component response regulator